MKLQPPGCDACYRSAQILSGMRQTHPHWPPREANKVLLPLGSFASLSVTKALGTDVGGRENSERAKRKTNIECSLSYVETGY